VISMRSKKHHRSNTSSRLGILLSILCVSFVVFGIVVVKKVQISAEVKGDTTSCPSIINPKTGKAYETINIGALCWMKEDLMNPQGSENASYPLTFFSSSEATGACPSGWRLPVDKEWAVINTKQSLPLLNLSHRGQVMGSYIQNNQYAVYWSGSATSTARNCFYKHIQASTLFSALIKEIENRKMAVRCVSLPVTVTPTPAPITSCPTTFTDSRDGKTYETILYGSTCWMKKNLNYGTEGKEKYCYNSAENNCSVYGGLYTYPQAQVACPSGWTLPTNAKWQAINTSALLPLFNFQYGGQFYNMTTYGQLSQYGVYWNQESGVYYKAPSWGTMQYYANSAKEQRRQSVRCVKNTSLTPTPTSTPSPTVTPTPISGSITRKVMVLDFNPVFENKGNKRLRDLLDWRNPVLLEQQYIADMHTVSGGYVHYQIVSRIENIDAFPIKSDGFSYTDDTYYSVLEGKTPPHQPDIIDYPRLLRAYDICGKRNRDEIDELWMWGGPWLGFWEAVMAGTNAYVTNASPITDTSCLKPLHIMGFSYERNIQEMLENFGHRTEGTLTHIFNESIYYHNTQPTDWGRFTQTGKFFPGQISGCGFVHYPPNATQDYDWSNMTNTLSTCQNWLQYPELSGVSQSINCNEWGCTAHGYMKWWLSHLPKTDGSTNGKWNNWWRYLLDAS